MAELHVIGALPNKRAELAGTLRQLEQHLAQQRANLAHLDAKVRLFIQISGRGTSLPSCRGSAMPGFVLASACG